MTPNTQKFHKDIIEILQTAQKKILYHVNSAMVTAYFEIGKGIVKNEQYGAEKAGYGKKIINDLSIVLTKNFGKGFSKRNLEQMRKFFIT